MCTSGRADDHLRDRDGRRRPTGRTEPFVRLVTTPACNNDAERAGSVSSRGAQFAGLFSCSLRLGFVASHWRGVSTYVPCARSRNAVIALALIGAPLQPT